MELEAYSLVTRAADAPDFSVHRLVQDGTRGGQCDDPAHAALTEALRRIDAAFASDAGDVRHRPLLEPLAPHAHAVAAHADAAGIAKPTSLLMIPTSVLLFGKALYAEAEPLSRRHLEIVLHFTAETGHQHPHPDTAMANYAGLLAQMGHGPEELHARIGAPLRKYDLRPVP